MSRGRALGPGKLWKRDANWVVDFTDAAGARRRKVLGGDKRVAERRRSEIMRKRDMAIDGLGAIEGQDMLLSEIAADYLVDLKPRVSTHHFRNVSGRLERTLVQLEGKTVRELKPVDVFRIRSQAVAERKSHRTANLIGGTLKAMLRWAVEMELIAKNPLQNLKPLPETAEHKVYRRRALSDDEIGRLLDASLDDDEKTALCARLKKVRHIPQTPMWRTLLDTGARWNELRLLEWQDIDFANGHAVFRAEHTKSRKRKVVPLGPGTLAVLRELKLHHQRTLSRLPRAGERVFLTPRGCGWARSSNNPMRIFNRVLKRAGIQKYHSDGTKLDIHALRHTFGTRLSRAGAPLVHTQRLMGHSDPKLTAQVYTHLDAEDLRGAIDGMKVPGDGRAAVRQAQIA